MNRQLIAVVLGVLVTAPAFSNSEIDPGNMSAIVTVAKSPGQVGEEILIAHRTRDRYFNAEIGNVYPAEPSSKTREQVKAELLQLYRAEHCIAAQKTAAQNYC